jgi:hypothetical protein
VLIAFLSAYRSSRVAGGANQSSAILKAFEGALKRFVAPTGVAQIITVKVRFVRKCVLCRTAFCTTYRPKGGEEENLATNNTIPAAIQNGQRHPTTTKLQALQ